VPKGATAVPQVQNQQTRLAIAAHKAQAKAVTNAETTAN
jgi:hypothetical protein